MMRGAEPGAWEESKGLSPSGVFAEQLWVT